MTTLNIISGIILLFLIAFWGWYGIRMNKKYYWGVGNLKIPQLPEKYKPSKFLKKSLKQVKKKHDIIVKCGYSFYLVNTRQELKKADMALLMNGQGEIHMTRCMTCDKYETFPPTFRDSSTLLEHDIVGVVVHVIHENPNDDSILEELDI